MLIIMINIINLIDQCDTLYSPICTINKWDITDDKIKVDTGNGYLLFDKYGHYLYSEYKQPSLEILLFPAIDNRDWKSMIKFKPGDFVEYRNIISYVYKDDDMKSDNNLWMIDCEGNNQSVNQVLSLPDGDTIVKVHIDPNQFASDLAENHFQLMKAIARYAVRNENISIYVIMDQDSDGIYIKYEAGYTTHCTNEQYISMKELADDCKQYNL